MKDIIEAISKAPFRILLMLPTAFFWGLAGFLAYLRAGAEGICESALTAEGVLTPVVHPAPPFAAHKTRVVLLPCQLMYWGVCARTATTARKYRALTMAPPSRSTR